MADANECNSPKTLLQQHLDSRPEFIESAEHKAFADRLRFILNDQSTGDVEKSNPLAFQKVNTSFRTKDRIHKTMKYNQLSFTSSTSSKFPIKIKRSQPTATNCYKRIKTSNAWTRSTFATNILQNGTDRYVQAGATATLSVPAQDSQGMDEQVVYPEGSSADRSGYPEYTTLWIPD